MKKRYTSSRYKVINTNLSLDRFYRKVFSRYKRKSLNRKKLNQSQNKTPIVFDPNLATDVPAPKEFSFVQNPNEISAFISNLVIYYQRKTQVNVLLHDITTLGYDAVVVLMSILIKFKLSRIPFNGSKPKDNNLRQKLEDSDFFYAIGIKKFRHNQNSIGTNEVCTNWNSHVEGAVIAKLISNSTTLLFGKVRRAQGAYRVLIELMLNTNNHAGSRNNKPALWWLSINFNAAEEKITFSFVDYGVGIFRSLSSKKRNSKWGGLKKALNKIGIDFDNQVELMRKLLDGEIHSLVHGERHRGNGLPGIVKVFKRQQISNLHVISNSVHADVGGDEYKKLDSNFEGTFIYFELTKINFKQNVKNINSQ